MALWLTEADVSALLNMDDVITAVEDGFRLLGEGAAVNQPRSRIVTPSAVLHVMHAAAPTLGVMGLKSYAVSRRGARFVAVLYRLEDGEAVVLAEADRLGQMRTGAASAVATKHMARAEAGALGIIGAGWQARSQVQAIARVRPVALVKVFSRSEERREAFASEMVAELGTEVVAVASAEEAVDGCDIVVAATSARDPVLRGDWLRPGMHVNAIGSNAATRVELDVNAVRRSDHIAVDSLEQARAECGDLIAAERQGEPVWNRVVEFGAIAAGKSRGREAAEEITLFESQGIALEDVMTMNVLYQKAAAAGVGQHLSVSKDAVRVRR